MIENTAPEKLVQVLSQASYTKIYIQHSFNLDVDLLGRAFWVYNPEGALVREWLLTDPSTLGFTAATIPALVSGTKYTVRGQFFDKMIDPELLQAKFGINISEPIDISTKKPPVLSNIVVSATSVEVGVSSPTVSFSYTGDADFIEIQYKYPESSDWVSCYSGQGQAPLSIILPVGKYNFRLRGTISLPDGVTIEQSNWSVFPTVVDVQYKANPPTKPTGIDFKVQKIKDGVERYDLKVGWVWERLQGQQIKQFILEYTPTSKFGISGWQDAQRVNTSSTNFQILTNFPYNIPFKFRVIADSWGPNDSTMSTQSDQVNFILDANTPITDSFIKQTGVEVGYYGINQYTGTGQARVQTFKLDQATGNMSIGIVDALGKVPFSFDAINNILNISGRVITDIINSASFVLTNTSGTPPKLYSQEKENYGSPMEGIWMGYSGAKFLFDLGNSQQFLRWDGNKLIISGSVQIGTPSGDTTLNDAIQGKVIVPVYRTSTSQPSRPTSTSYPPAGWSTSPTSYNPSTEKVWVSSQRIDPLTNTTLPEYPWTTPIQFTGSPGPTGSPGAQGPTGSPGAPGPAGGKGPGMYAQGLNGTVTSFNESYAQSFFNSNFGTGPSMYDVLTQFNIANPSQQVTKMWVSGAWKTPALVVHGDMIATGTIRGEALVADSAFLQKAGINTIYDRNAQLSSNPEGNYKMKIDLAQGYIHIR